VLILDQLEQGRLDLLGLGDLREDELAVLACGLDDELATSWHE
jgi:hypothetical protein